MDVPYTKKEKELLRYIAAGYQVERPNVHPDVQRKDRIKYMEWMHQTDTGHYRYGGYEVSKEEYFQQYLYGRQASDDNYTELELKAAKEWAKRNRGNFKQTKDEEYGEFVKTSASETGKLILFLCLLGLGIIFWPMFIVAIVSGGFLFGGERFLK